MEFTEHEKEAIHKNMLPKVLSYVLAHSCEGYFECVRKEYEKSRRENNIKWYKE